MRSDQYFFYNDNAQVSLRLTEFALLTRFSFLQAFFHFPLLGSLKMTNESIMVEGYQKFMKGQRLKPHTFEYIVFNV